MNKAILTARVLLGLIFVVFGLNFWLHFIALPPMSGNAGAFVGLLYASGYLAVVKVLEVIGGLAALAGRTTLALLILSPIILNILLLDVFLAHAFNPLSALAAVLAVFLALAERQRFAALLK